jgi:hypothetical protein
VLPEQGRSPATPLGSRAWTRRHGAATGSARTRRPDYLTLPAGCGHAPALVATVNGVALAAAPAVATSDLLFV